MYMQVRVSGHMHWQCKRSAQSARYFLAPEGPARRKTLVSYGAIPIHKFRVYYYNTCLRPSPDYLTRSVGNGQLSSVARYQKKSFQRPMDRRWKIFSCSIRQSRSQACAWPDRHGAMHNIKAEMHHGGPSCTAMDFPSDSRQCRPCQHQPRFSFPCPVVSAAGTSLA